MYLFSVFCVVTPTILLCKLGGGGGVHPRRVAVCVGGSVCGGDVADRACMRICLSRTAINSQFLSK